MIAALMTKLLDYVLEQAKEVDPRGFTLKGHEGFLKSALDMAGLPGVDFDLKSEGDHLWLRVPRLGATKAPELPAPAATWKDIIVYSDDPNGSSPTINERMLGFRIVQAQKEHREKVEREGQKEAIE